MIIALITAMSKIVSWIFVASIVVVLAIVAVVYAAIVVGARAERRYRYYHPKGT